MFSFSTEDTEGEEVSTFGFPSLRACKYSTDCNMKLCNSFIYCKKKDKDLHFLFKKNFFFLASVTGSQLLHDYVGTDLDLSVAFESNVRNYK